jgi:hypothetical protein
MDHRMLFREAAQEAVLGASGFHGIDLDPFKCHLFLRVNHINYDVLALQASTSRTPWSFKDLSRIYAHQLPTMTQIDSICLNA